MITIILSALALTSAIGTIFIIKSRKGGPADKLDFEIGPIETKER